MRIMQPGGRHEHVLVAIFYRLNVDFDKLLGSPATSLRTVNTSHDDKSMDGFFRIIQLLLIGMKAYRHFEKLLLDIADLVSGKILQPPNL